MPRPRHLSAVQEVSCIMETAQRPRSAWRTPRNQGQRYPFFA